MHTTIHFETEPLGTLLDILCAAQTVIFRAVGADRISTSCFPLICSTLGALLGVWPTVMALRGFYVLCPTSDAFWGIVVALRGYYVLCLCAIMAALRGFYVLSLRSGPR
ncbi:hypothetical protein C8J57DRAFT_727821 [Mycena rebaudengoi]|nr:hypothetical protein C8J57DRAFT_727821 [Mycena rebaudengoi]